MQKVNSIICIAFLLKSIKSNNFKNQNKEF